MRLEELVGGVRVTGVVPGEAVLVIAALKSGPNAVHLYFEPSSGVPDQRMLFREDEANLARAESGGRPLDADPLEFRLVAEAQRISLAGLFDPMPAVATSDVRPLPHQIRAVYGELLERRPLRFLLADDPGAGKTVMAGLYLKELLLRDDVRRCLVVVPGGLVDQWQDELFLKFGLGFEVLSPSMADAALGSGVFAKHPLLIARMDQLARNEQLSAQLDEAEFDLVVVDEAHRMGAHHFGGKVNRTKRFQLGERLRDRTRHLLLMTATPHSGKEEDFQLFLTLLDPDGFEGRPDGRGVDTTGVMRRMVKEDLLTFEGRPLFPERVAETVPYRLSEHEQDLYEQVTEYVREGMNRAERLEDKRRNTVGFALTVLQRRLASSPEAIHRSLVRRSQRLERRRADLLAGRATPEPGPVPATALHGWDDDEHTAEEVERVEEEMVDAATAARTAAELAAELAELGALVSAARRVCELDTDRKWVELRRILQDNDLIHPDARQARKLIVFTEHRDTLDHLDRKIGALFGAPGSVLAIHGGVNRFRRREITEEFTANPACRVLLATDAAGEGLNLQAAHMVVNYDLPWNPNRIEQRFGRVHRIGQTEVCRLWNLVAVGTREGEVFATLLRKVEEQRKAYGGKVFDVLGSAFDETPLRDLLIAAIRYGERPETRERMERVIDDSVSHGLTELLREQALAHDVLPGEQLARLRRDMEEARARRLQPHCVEWFFRNAFQRLGGRLVKREKGRFEITGVPAGVRAAGGTGPVASAYRRVVFDLDRARVDGAPAADLLAPGHGLYDAVAKLTERQLAPALERGTVLLSASVDRPQLLVGVREEVVDGTGESISRRFGYALVDETGTITPAGPAPYLDCVAPPEPVARPDLPWLVDAESRARDWIAEHRLREYLEEVRERRLAEVGRVRDKVERRLTDESRRLLAEAAEAEVRERAGLRPKESSEGLRRKSDELLARREDRLALLDRQVALNALPPRIMTAALVLPVAGAGAPSAPSKAVERRGVELVLATERALGRSPEEKPFSNPGYDVLSTPPDGGPSIRIEVKARAAGAEDFQVTHNEVITGKNAAPHYRLALVSVSPDGPEHDLVRYVAEPFSGVDFGDLAATGVRADWARTWASGSEPF
ncbi:DUF3883 domain-containing protein [Actinosynnema pretiosum subsp. pretiosum]|uniref:DUF3883 domain-containing protein n=1 Tax=Actinosynnema pretiosum subsp. pretiosum TaxID=103721 RepID=A0AA45R438_9PSEU|nr:Superfamily II DNA/RNA helicase, SNF2 family [Actinosynnema pretiosum subsp. pretiosum]QUF04486.1 DUF3883 domain-containing protein [Actinosynnema pretiosum subsp. pretiosum]